MQTQVGLLNELQSETEVTVRRWVETLWAVHGFLSEKADAVSFAGRFGIVLELRRSGSESKYKQVNRRQETGMVQGHEW